MENNNLYFKKLIIISQILLTCFISSFSISYAATTIDITNYVKDITTAGCDHLSKVREWNTSQSWDRCLLCGTKTNYKNHTISSSWEEAMCRQTNYKVDKCTASNCCGNAIIARTQYSSNSTNGTGTYPRIAHSVPTSYTQDSYKYRHFKRCTRCDETVIAGSCTDAQGTISCTSSYATPRTCRDCGMRYDKPYHEVRVEREYGSTDSYNANTSMNCNKCGKNFGTIRFMYINKPVAGVLQGRFGFTVNNLSYINSSPGFVYDMSNYITTYNYEGSSHYHWANQGNGKIDANVAVKFPNYRTESGGFFNYGLAFSTANEYWRIVSYNNVCCDTEKPTISSISITYDPTTAINGYYRKATVRITGAEAGPIVNVKVGNNQTVSFSKTASLVPSSYDFTFDINFEINSVANYTFSVSDMWSANGSTSSTKQLSKLDHAAPTLSVTPSTPDTAWTTSKTVTIQGTDSGSGIDITKLQGKTSINGADATSLGTNAQTFEFTGTFTEKQLAVYMVDKMGYKNIQYVTIKNVDNIKPGISNFSYNSTNNTITAIVSDSDSKLSGFAISTSSTVVPTSWNSTSGATQGLSYTVPTSYVGETVYLWVKDNAGNVNVSNSPVSIQSNDDPVAPTIIPRKIVDITGVITDTNVAVHDCNNYSILKYDGTYHWRECSICSPKYVNAGRPDSNVWTNDYLEIKTNGSGLRILAIKNSLTAHTITSQGWTMGESCHPNNQLKHICDCGYSYYTNNTRPHNFLNGGQLTVYSPADYAACKRCGDCLANVVIEYCYNSRGKISCDNLGTCMYCNYNYTIKSHRYSGRGMGDVKCNYCNRTVLGNIQTATVTTNADHTVSFRVSVRQNDTAQSTGNNWIYVRGGTVDVVSQNYNYNNYVSTMTATVKVKSGYIQDVPLNDVTVYYVRRVSANEDFYITRIFDGVKFDTVTPTATVSQTVLNSVGDWITSTNISVSGTENYCTSVTIEMKAPVNNSTIYAGTAGVSGGNYSLSFTPNISNSEPKTYSIVVTDSMGNAKTTSIIIQKCDSAPPTYVKTGQIIVEDEEEKWSTPIAWSKTKDFDIRGIDEGANYFEMKIQDITSTRTSTTFSDTYGITSSSDSSYPIEYTRSYTFTGNVKGYETLLTDGKDGANNVVSDYFRVYNLDNEEPGVESITDNGTSWTSTKATLKDEYSGIRYFGLVPYGSGTVTYPTTYTNTDTTTATDMNKWYRVAEVPADTTAGTPASGQSSIEVIVNVPENGQYFIITEDYVGNRNYTPFTFNKYELTPPTGTITLKNPLIAIDGSKGVNTNTALLEINAEDDSGVEYMALANEDARNTISWIPYATEYTWTLSAGDGRKTVYVMFKDSRGNVSISFTP